MENAEQKERKPYIYSRAEPRLDFSKFEDHFRKAYHDDTEFSRHIGITRDQLRNFRTRGIRFYVADRLCIDNGVHPSYIWGEDYWKPPRKVLERYKHLEPKEEA